jgi:hypothetical protein
MSARIFDEIVAAGGLDLSTTQRDEAIVALHDALDLLRRMRGSRRLRVAGRVAAGVGTLGWLGGAIAAMTIAHDVVAALISVAASAGFAGVGVYMVRSDRRLQPAERLLEDQLRNLEGAELKGWTDRGDGAA